MESQVYLNNLIKNYDNHCELIKNQCLVNRDFSQPLDYNLIQESELKLKESCTAFIKLDPINKQLRYALQKLTEIPCLSSAILEHYITKELGDKDLKIIKKFNIKYVESSKSIFASELKNLANQVVL